MGPTPNSFNQHTTVRLIRLFLKIPFSIFYHIANFQEVNSGFSSVVTSTEQHSSPNLFEPYQMGVAGPSHQDFVNHILNISI